jgi:hypothetical protein
MKAKHSTSPQKSGTSEEQQVYMTLYSIFKKSEKLQFGKDKVHRKGGSN